MSIIPSGLQDKYFQISRAFIDDLGKTITLYYPPLNLTNTSGAASVYGLNSFNAFGEPMEITSLGGRETQEGGNLREVPVTDSVKVRVYWERSINVIASLGLSLNEKVCKITCYLSDVPKLQQAIYAEVDAEHNPLIKLRVTKVRDFVPYGIGQPRYATSYWKAV